MLKSRQQCQGQTTSKEKEHQADQENEMPKNQKAPGINNCSYWNQFDKNKNKVIN